MQPTVRYFQINAVVIQATGFRKMLENKSTHEHFPWNCTKDAMSRYPEYHTPGNTFLVIHPSNKKYGTLVLWYKT